MEFNLNDYTFSIPEILLIIFIIYTLVLTVKVLPKIKFVKEKEKTNLENLIEKKDLAYWILILCLGSISVFTYEYSGDKEAINHWSFAGTIVSIILAVIAIIFTFYQSFSNEVSANKIEKAADKITAATIDLDVSELKQSSDVINNLAENMRIHNENLQSKINAISNELSGLKSDQFEHQNYIKSLIKSNININKEEDKNNSQFTFTKESFDSWYMYAPFRLKLMLYAIYRLHESGIEITKDALTTYTTKVSEYEFTDEKNQTNFTKGLTYGVNLQVEMSILHVIAVHKTNIEKEKIIINPDIYHYLASKYSQQDLDDQFVNYEQIIVELIDECK
ncbi:hypothetical protein HF078_06915 [Bacillus sp. RO2]|uniref:hypothetical protein n=1 Tax=Bacillus sp. RO2 TaxID=2723913 RepID=UPI00145EF01D|nr:hypothetical protein [Bacillus sp. RO2]NMH72797.1 hypothetical protein [Bacillus sp. RO2]